MFGYCELTLQDAQKLTRAAWSWYVIMQPRLTPAHHAANKTTHAPVIGLPSAKQRAFSIADVMTELTLQPLSITIVLTAQDQNHNSIDPRCRQPPSTGQGRGPVLPELQMHRAELYADIQLYDRCDSSRASDKLRLARPCVGSLHQLPQLMHHHIPYKASHLVRSDQKATQSEQCIRHTTSIGYLV
ncbi:hypothetical protein CC79DRAFT_907996 [Sarocladium strictum]